MVKENKTKAEIKEKKCDCGPDCKCGCQEGKECTCSEKVCHCGCHGECPCKRSLGKILFLALVFFAGMGVNQFMNDSCIGRCPGRKMPHPMPMINAPQIQGSLPTFTDGAGNTIIIINTGEKAGKHGFKGHKHGKFHAMGNMPHHGKRMSEQPENPQPEE